MVDSGNTSCDAVFAMATTQKFDTALLEEDMTLLGWLPIDLARKAEVADMTVYRFLRGERQTARVAKKLAEALGYTLRRYLISRSQRVA